MTQLPIRPVVPQFERPPVPDSEAGGEIDAFNAFLSGQEELASATGGVSAVDFVRDTVESALDQGLDLSGTHLTLIIKSAFGDPIRVADLLSGYTEIEATDRYGDLLPVLLEYASSEIEE